MSDFDVFLCHNSKDKPDVEAIGRRLIEMNMKPWLDDWEIPPGESWIQYLSEHLDRIQAAAVFVGQKGIGPWQAKEIELLLISFVQDKKRVVPVILPCCEVEPHLPLFLKGVQMVDFRKLRTDPLKKLFWGITGERWSPKPTRKLASNSRA